eukprot:CAMPEP_0170453466 /NCGR_PEP_ID=MMETSP0123-20130129/2036_1 /TAXON_ID=182087 /ORGANISM="Favella ehrenbergii, Strain Fehren 1" /LENGTH=89 /DNA_ID=CAMNT_0010715843 /DNA_START=751 /DNA_END=1020 /DNA_ORIENTATION=+
MAIELVIQPKSVKAHTIGPDLGATPMPLLLVPLPDIFGLILHYSFVTLPALQPDFFQHRQTALVIEFIVTELDHDVADGTRTITPRLMI